MLKLRCRPQSHAQTVGVGKDDTCIVAPSPAIPLLLAIPLDDYVGAFARKAFKAFDSLLVSDLRRCEPIIFEVVPEVIVVLRDVFHAGLSVQDMAGRIALSLASITVEI
ncbi:hypothetical protein ADL01_35525 [Streptomyces sp. NRRL WC-3618]|nr:hypothetical protein ADL01_35525 [Streptomyces sp. NRRL WC-3618]